MRMWLSGRASPCQGEGREFESRHPLHFFVSLAQLDRASGYGPVQYKLSMIMTKIQMDISFPIRPSEIP